MATQSTFLCECGEIIGRMDKKLKWLPWNTSEGDPVMKGTSCNKCKQGWLWRDPENVEAWVNVEKCCKILMCGCE